MLLKFQIRCCSVPVETCFINSPIPRFSSDAFPVEILEKGVLLQRLGDTHCIGATEAAKADDFQEICHIISPLAWSSEHDVYQNIGKPWENQVMLKGL
jgi:hypothetical protein